jgi:putative hydrolase of the HAD superfamily
VTEPDAVGVLGALRARGFALAAVSNADGRVEADLVRYGLRDALDLVIDSHVVGVEKPDPAIFVTALDRLGVAPAAAVHVGDIASIDVAGAQRAGIAPVLMDPLGCYVGTVDCPRIRRLGELLDLLPGRAAPAS